jgi:UDP-glucuronate 4-epimerase
MTAMNILVTGAAGFIGFHLSKRLAEMGYNITGIDNINDYYPVTLKLGRLCNLGLDRTLCSEEEPEKSLKSIKECDRYHASSILPSFKFRYADISNLNTMEEIFNDGKFNIVCNLAAQAGVRYSFENPDAYIKSNINGFFNILKLSEKYKIQHLIYASSSSVYGNNNPVPYRENSVTDYPQSLYAATKKSDELMAYVYSSQMNLATTGLRYFTVYGPWGRPDMAPFHFMKSIIEGKPIKVFNNGNLSRDFSYIDDIITGTVRVIESSSAKSSTKEINELQTGKKIPYKIYNIGNSHPVRLMDFIETIERVTGKEAIKEFVGMQQGDVYTTYAETSLIQKEFGFKPDTPLEHGIEQFFKWYKEFFRC